MTEDVVISWGVGFYSAKQDKNITHHVTGVFVDVFNSSVRATVQKGLEVQTVNLTIERAQDIGFINFEALSVFLK